VGHFKAQFNHSADSTKVLLIWRVSQRYCNHSYVLEIPASIQVLYGCLSLCVELMQSLSQKKSTAGGRPKRQNPAMSLQKSVFTSDDLLQLMLNLLAQVPW